MNKVNYQKTSYFNLFGFQIWSFKTIYTEQSYDDIKDDIVIMSEEGKKDDK